MHDKFRQTVVVFKMPGVINYDSIHGYIFMDTYKSTGSFKADLRDQIKLIHDKISPDNKTQNWIL